MDSSLWPALQLLAPAHLLTCPSHVESGYLQAAALGADGLYSKPCRQLTSVLEPASYLRHTRSRLPCQANSCVSILLCTSHTLASPRRTYEPPPIADPFQFLDDPRNQPAASAESLSFNAMTATTSKHGRHQ